STQFTSQFCKSFQKHLATQVGLTRLFILSNNSYQLSIQMAPFEELYQRRCRSPICWFEVNGFTFIGLELVHEDIKKV
ncbi:hypothetical protein MTR67_002121, partial [Solanum verrucosum]